MDFEAIKKAAEGYRADMSRFLRDMIAIPSESCEEEGVIMRIKAELEKLGLTVPDTVLLLDSLRQGGMDVPLDAVTVDECVDAIMKNF